MICIYLDVDFQNYSLTDKNSYHLVAEGNTIFLIIYDFSHNKQESTKSTALSNQKVEISMGDSKFDIYLTDNTITKYAYKKYGEYTQVDQHKIDIRGLEDRIVYYLTNNYIPLPFLMLPKNGI